MRTEKPNSKILLSVAALSVPLIGLGLWHILAGNGHDLRLSEVLPQSGYRELNPPSRLYPPGTIATVESLPDKSLRLHLTCTIKPEVLASLWQDSSTVAKRFDSDFASSFSSEANALSIAVARATGNRVRRVSMSLQNAHVVTISDENLIRIRKDFLKGNCEQAVIWNLEAGAKVCQTEEVLRADLAYKMSYSSGLGAREKLDLANQVAGTIVGTNQVKNADEIRGNDLYFGVKLNAHCFKLNADTVVWQ